MNKGFNFDEVSFSFVERVWAHIYECIAISKVVRRFSPNLRQRVYSLSLIFRSLCHTELIFIYGVMQGSSFIFSMGVQLSQHPM